MAPRKPHSKRKQPTPSGSEIMAYVDLGQMISEYLADVLPDLVSEISASVRQSLRDSNPGGSENRTGAGGSGDRDSGAVGTDVTGKLQQTDKIGTAFEIRGGADRSKAIVAAGASTDGEMPTCEDEEIPGYKRSREDVRNPTPLQSFTVEYPKRTGYAGQWPECSKCGRHHQRSLACWICSRCRMLGHTEKFCKTCFDCDRPDHRRDRCSRRGNSTDSSRGGAA